MNQIKFDELSCFCFPFVTKKQCYEMAWLSEYCYNEVRQSHC